MWDRVQKSKRNKRQLYNRSCHFLRSFHALGSTCRLPQLRPLALSSSPRVESGSATDRTWNPGYDREGRGAALSSAALPERKNTIRLSPTTKTKQQQQKQYIAATVHPSFLTPIPFVTNYMYYALYARNKRHNETDCSYF